MSTLSWAARRSRNREHLAAESGEAISLIDVRFRQQQRSQGEGARHALERSGRVHHQLVHPGRRRPHLIVDAMNLVHHAIAPTQIRCDGDVAIALIAQRQCTETPAPRRRDGSEQDP